MNFPSSTIEQKIVELLSVGQLSKPELLTIISGQLGVTVSAVYYGLAKLQRKAIVVEDKSDILKINKTWIEKFDIQFSQYRNQETQKSYLSMLGEGQKVTYKFTDFHIFTAFWDNASLELLAKLDTDGCKEKKYLYIEPHPAWMMYFPELSDSFYRIITAKGYTTYSLMHQPVTEIQRQTIKRLRGLGMQVSFENKTPIYLNYNIFGNYIIKSKYDKDLSEFLLQQELSGLDMTRMRQVVEDSLVPVTLEILCDSKKAAKMWKQYQKLFV